MFWLFLHGCMFVMWMYLNVHIGKSQFIRWMWIHANWACSVYVWKQAVKKKKKKIPGGCWHMISVCHMCQIYITRSVGDSGCVCVYIWYRPRYHTVSTKTLLMHVYAHSQVSHVAERGSCPCVTAIWLNNLRITSQFSSSYLISRFKTTLRKIDLLIFPCK